jgi:hypothetical protein
MGKVDEANEKAMLAMSLRRQNMTVSKIALYLNTNERHVYSLLARARKLWSLIADAGDSKTRIGETLTAFEEMERLALEKFAKANPNSNVAVAYLNAARDARKEIKRLQQEAGLMTKVAEEFKITGLPIERPEVMSLALELIKVSQTPAEKNDGDNFS